MRLSKKYIFVIKKYFNDFFQNGEIYLFGSRVFDDKKGGDIDLYLKVDNHTNLFLKKLNFYPELNKS